MLPRGELSSLYYPKLRKETEALFRLFYYAKDFDTFYKTALWARIYINEMQFGKALFTAITLRDDIRFIQLPPPYELYPYSSIPKCSRKHITQNSSVNLVRLNQICPCSSLSLQSYTRNQNRDKSVASEVFASCKQFEEDAN